MDLQLGHLQLGATCQSKVDLQLTKQQIRAQLQVDGGIATMTQWVRVASQGLSAHGTIKQLQGQLRVKRGLATGTTTTSG
jgi:hypothetical protein